MKKLFAFMLTLTISICFSQNFAVSKKINLPGDGGWDYLAVDDVNQNLFVSHGDVVNVANLKTNTFIATIEDTKGVHGIAIANDLNKAFISCGKDNSISIVDLLNFKLLDKVKIEGQKPDAILYDKFSKQVFIFNAKSNNATVLDAVSNKTIKNLPLVGKPEFAVTNDKGLIYVNIEDENQMKTIDTKTLLVVATFSILPGDEPSGLAFDKSNNRLFSVCGNKMMVVVDAKSGKIIQNIPIGDGCDGVVFDTKRKLIFAANGEGTMTVIKQNSKDSYSVLDTVSTQKGARTIALNPSSGIIYTTTPDFGAKPEPTPENPKPRSSITPNSFSILVIEKK